MKPYRYLLWDMDGTLVNTYEGVSRSLAPAFEFYNVHMDGDDYYPYIGPPMRESIPEHTDCPAELLEDVIARFRERYNTIGVFECELFPGVREALAALRSAGYTQLIASSKPEERCRDILDKFGIADLFDDVVGASMDGRIDSKIEVLDEAFARMRERWPDFSPEETVLIGDTHCDTGGARQAGIDCLGVAYGFGGRAELEAGGAAAVYEDLAELTEALLRTKDEKDPEAVMGNCMDRPKNGRKNG